MKLLFILPEYSREPVGGIRSFYCELLPALARAGCEVKVLLARREFVGRDGFTDGAGVQVEYVRADLLEKHDRAYQESQFAGHWLMGQFVPVANAAFEQARAGEGFDLVEVTDWPLLFLPWVGQRKPKVPFTISLHSSVGQMMEYEGKGGKTLDAALVRMCETLGFGAAPSVHANSNLNARYWEKITNRKVEVLLPLLRQKNVAGDELRVTCEKRPEVAVVSEACRVAHEEGKEIAVTSEGFSVKSEGRAAVASEGLGVKSGERSERTPVTPLLRGAVFARLQNWKGCEILAEALVGCPEIEMHWYGADLADPAEGCKWSESLAKKFPAAFGKNFFYHGVVEPSCVPALMAEADFVCVPSLWDVFNLSAVEAMAAGKVVLCSRQAGVEMLIEDGTNGFLFDPQKHGDLAAKLKAMAALTPEDRGQLGKAARQTVQTKLVPESLVAERIQFYRALAATPPQDNRNCFLPDMLELSPVPPKSVGQKFYRWMAGWRR